MTYQFKTIFCMTIFLLLTACGGGGSGDEASGGSVPIATRGVITQLGSIWVTGCRYVAAPGGIYKSDDDDSASFDDYEVGQLVSIRGRKNDDSVSCVADEVEYEAEIEGTADVNGKINGIKIVQTPKTNNTATGAPDPLNNGDRYEVSGIWIDDFTIEATFIKEDDDGGTGDTIDEIKGDVQFVTTASSFDVRDITFNMAGGAPHGVSVGNLVEVHFSLCTGTAPDIICTASEVELEDDFFDQAEGLEIEIEGAVDLDTTGCPAEAEFKVDGVCIDTTLKPALWMDGLTEFADLVQGSRVEAEGHMIGTAPNHYLRADKVKGRGNRVRVSSIAGTVNQAAGTFELIEGNISVTTMAGITSFEDGLFINAGADNVDGQTVEVRGVRTGLSELLALRIKLTGLSGGGDRHELRAEVDFEGVNKTDRQVTVMGVVTQGIAGISGTELELDDMAFPGTLDQFLEQIDDNDIATDGPRDVIDMDFDINPGDGSSSAPYEAHQYEIEEEDD